MNDGLTAIFGPHDGPATKKNLKIQLQNSHSYSQNFKLVIFQKCIKLLIDTTFNTYTTTGDERRFRTLLETVLYDGLRAPSRRTPA
jgi:hypothetical protein